MAWSIGIAVLMGGAGMIAVDHRWLGWVFIAVGVLILLRAWWISWRSPILLSFDGGLDGTDFALNKAPSEGQLPERLFEELRLCIRSTKTIQNVRATVTAYTSQGQVLTEKRELVGVPQNMNPTEQFVATIHRRTLNGPDEAVFLPGEREIPVPIGTSLTVTVAVTHSHHAPAMFCFRYWTNPGIRPKSRILWVGKRKRRWWARSFRS